MLMRAVAGLGRAAPLAVRSVLYPHAKAAQKWAPVQRSVRCFGVWDTVQNYTGKLQDDQKHRQFAQQIEGFLKMDRWSLQPMKDMLDDTATWKTWLMGKAEKEQVKHYKAIFGALTRNEIQNPSLIDRAVIERICGATKADGNTVRQFLLTCERLKLLYEYTHLLKRAGEPVPSSEEDFVRRQTIDPRFQQLAVREMTRVRNKGGKMGAKPVSVKMR